MLGHALALRDLGVDKSVGQDGAKLPQPLEQDRQGVVVVAMTRRLRPVLAIAALHDERQAQGIRLYVVRGV